MKREQGEDEGPGKLLGGGGVLRMGMVPYTNIPYVKCKKTTIQMLKRSANWKRCYLELLLGSERAKGGMKGRSNPERIFACTIYRCMYLI